MKPILALLVLAAAAPAAAQQVRFDDVIRNLRNPDPEVRLEAVRLLREAKYPEAIVPVAALITDPVDQIQLEAIATELSFFLGEEVSPRKRVALVFERRSSGHAAAAFDAGPLVVLPRPVPSEIIRGLLQAADDEAAKVRMEAIYALGVIARPPFPSEFEAPLIKVLDHYDPAMRAAAEGLGRSGDTSEMTAMQTGAGTDPSEMVRAAMAFALHKLGRNYVPRLAEFMDSSKTAPQVGEYFLELGPGVVPALLPHLQDPDASIRANIAVVLGGIGGEETVKALQPLLQDKDSDVARAAQRAISRIKESQK
jgi:HEAT repeat protein